MALTWVVQHWIGNSGSVDTNWIFSIGLVGAGTALWPVWANQRRSLPSGQSGSAPTSARSFRCHLREWSHERRFRHHWDCRTRAAAGRRDSRRHPTAVFAHREWCWSGMHYQRTANDWLVNFDRNREAIEAALRPVYGNQTALWMRRWRWFFLATAGLFGHADDTEWGVSHYRLKAAGQGVFS
jgi:hypothetical protein